MEKIKKSIERYERKWVFDNIDYNQLIILLHRSKLFFSTQFLIIQDHEDCLIDFQLWNTN